MQTMNSEKSVFDNEMADVQVQIEAERKKSEEEENKLMNSQVKKGKIVTEINMFNLLFLEGHRQFEAAQSCHSEDN